MTDARRDWYIRSVTHVIHIRVWYIWYMSYMVYVMYIDDICIYHICGMTQCDRCHLYTRLLYVVYIDDICHTHIWVRGGSCVTFTRKCDTHHMCIYEKDIWVEGSAAPTYVSNISRRVSVCVTYVCVTYTRLRKRCSYLYVTHTYVTHTLTRLRDTHICDTHTYM